MYRSLAGFRAPPETPAGYFQRLPRPIKFYFTPNAATHHVTDVQFQTSSAVVCPSGSCMHMTWLVRIERQSNHTPPCMARLSRGYFPSSSVTAVQQLLFSTPPASQRTTDTQADSPAGTTPALVEIGLARTHRFVRKLYLCPWHDVRLRRL